MKTNASKLDLHARLKRHSFEHAFITTFTFRPSFFEEYALEAFGSLQNNGNITVIVDEGQYQEILRLANENPLDFPKQANVRYLLHPIRVNGIFHPKISLFTSKRRGLLLIGSANFTQDGLGSNAELVAAFDFEEEKKEESLPLFLAAVDFLHDLSERWPAENLTSNLNELLRETPWLTCPEPPAPTPGLPELLSNLKEPLWDQLLRRIASPPSAIAVVSRFFDRSPQMVDQIITSSGAEKMVLYTQNEITSLTPEWLNTPNFQSGRLTINLCNYADDEHPQHLHGKGYAFTSGDQILLAVGSANFTTPALLRTAASGNVEVLLCYPPLPATDFQPARLFDPLSNARPLTHPQDLVTSPENPDDPKSAEALQRIQLIEAAVEEEHLDLKLREPVNEGGLKCILYQVFEQGACRPEYLTALPVERDRLRCKLPEKLLKDLRKRSSMVQLGKLTEQGWSALSNLLLVTNLQDINTNQDQRRQRQIREARESPERFMEVLARLSTSGDEEALKNFLTYCDIPLDLPVKLLRGRRRSSTPEGDFAEGLTPIGQRNLIHFEMLHDAVMHFASRHERRLRQHVDRGTVRGIPNFLHILLTVQNLLLSQIDRVIAALKAEENMEIDSDQWSQTRQGLDDCFLRLKSLLQLTLTDYLAVMISLATKDEIQQAFSDDLPLLQALVEKTVTKRKVVVDLVEERLRIRTNAGNTTGAQFFQSWIGPKNWASLLREFDTLRTVLQALAA